MRRALLLAVLGVSACRGAGTQAEVEVEARAALAAVPGDLARGGPLAWLDHLDDAPDFWMASEGEVKFPSYAAARAAMEAFGPTIARMELDWSDVSIDVLTRDLASFGAGYDELLIDTAGVETRFAGYVTGLLRRTPAGWRIAQLHWSMLP